MMDISKIKPINPNGSREERIAEISHASLLKGQHVLAQRGVQKGNIVIHPNYPLSAVVDSIDGGLAIIRFGEDTTSPTARVSCHELALMQTVFEAAAVLTCHVQAAKACYERSN
jgi:hypothetical protein